MDTKLMQAGLSMTREQRRRNRIAGGVLLFFVVVTFAWTIFKGGSLFAGSGG